MNQCPQCSDTLEQFAIKCERCGWEIAAVSPSSDGSDPATSSPPKRAKKVKKVSADDRFKGDPSAPPIANASGPPPIPGSQSAPSAPSTSSEASAKSKPSPKRKPSSIVKTDSDSGKTPASNSNPSQSADQEFSQGVALLESEDFAAALTHFNRAIVIAPVERLGEFYSLRGYCHLKKTEFRRAEKDCTEAIALNCCDPQTYAWRAAARGEQLKWPAAFDDLDRACIAAGPERDTYIELMDSYATTAREYYKKEIASGNESADLFFSRGWVYFRCGKYENAFRDFQLAIKLEPDHPWAWTGMAKLWCVKTINLRQYFEDNSSGVELVVPVPDGPEEVIRWCGRGDQGDLECRREALKIRARLHRQLGNVDAEANDLRTLLDLAGDDPDARVTCCELWFELGLTMPAVTELNQVLKGSPGFQKALRLRGRCFADVKNYSLASSDLKRYLSLNPEDHVVGIELARVCLATNRLDEAERHFENAINSDHSSFDAYLGFSHVFLKKKMLDLALAQCEKAIKIDSSRAEAFGTIAEIYQQLGDDTRAIDSYSRAVQIATDDDTRGNYLYLRGAVYYSINLFESALSDFQKSCQLRPNHAGGLVWKAATSSRLEQWTEAITCLNRAMEIRPNAARQYQQLGQPVAHKAIRHFNRQLLVEQNDPEIYRDRALANQFISMFASSIDDLTTALELQPKSADLLIRRGQVYAEAGDQKSAIDDFTRAIKIERRNHLARFYRAQARVKCGQIDRAQRDIQKAIRLDALQPAYHSLLANIYLDNEQLDQVVSSLNHSILLDPTDVAAFQLRGETQARRKNYFFSISDLTRALELDPTQIELLVIRGQVHAKAEEHQAAVEDFEMALSRDPQLSKAYSGRAMSLAALDQHEYATIWLTKAFHRFKKPRDLAELLFARGKILHQMVLYGAAIVDFTSVARIMQKEPKVVMAAKYARAIARVHAGLSDLAERDFLDVVKIDPQHDPSKLALHWMANRDSVPLPPFLVEPVCNQRPMRPPVVRSKVDLKTRPRDWRAERQYDTWVLRTLEKKEYGPIHREVLDQWIAEGRIDFGMKLLRADWSKWQRVERVFKELQPVAAGDQKTLDAPTEVADGNASSPTEPS